MKLNNLLTVSPKENDDDVAVPEKFRTYKRLDFDINKQFLQYLKLKYNGNEEAINLNSEQEFDNVVRLGLIQAEQQLSSNDSILLHKERKPRKDVWESLGRIAKEFLACYTYPKIHGGNLREMLNKSLGNKDHRIIKDYRKTVLIYSNFKEDVIKRCTNDNKLGELDVSFFVSLIPKQYITSSSSSLEE